MANIVAKKEKQNAIQQLASRLNVSEKALQDTLLKTAFSACKTNEEFVAAVIVANTYKLNPILKEMYVFPSRGGIIPIVSIDGWISLVNRHPDFNGATLIENEDEESPGGLKSVTATFHLKSKDHPVVITEYMNECYNENKEPWKKWPRRMLRHKAYIQGARIAFGFSGIYDDDEGERIIEAQLAEKEEPTMKPFVEMPKAIEASTDEAAEVAEEFAEEIPSSENDKQEGITEKQRKKLYAVANAKKIPEAAVKAKMAELFGKKSSLDLTKNEASELIDWLDKLEEC